MPEIKQSRSSLQPENLQEVLDAAASEKQATLGWSQQYETPSDLAALLNGLLPDTPRAILDPQCASGKTLRHGIPSFTDRFGCDIDNRFRDAADGIKRITGNCVKFWAVLDDVYPDLEFECQVANPPFGLWWELPNGTKADSTEYTWRKIMERAAPNGYGWFMANHKTIERLGIHNHERVYLYQKFPAGVWDNCGVEIGVVHWHASRNHPPKVTLVYPTLDYTEHAEELEKLRQHYLDYHDPNAPRDLPGGDLRTVWLQVQTILDEEKKSRPDFNIWVKDGRLKTYLSTRTKIKRKLSREDVTKLCRLDDCHPLTLTVDRETRKLLDELVNCGFYTIQPEAKQAILDALGQVSSLSVPLMPVTDFERVAYADESDSLLCIHGVSKQFTKGRKYELTTATYSFVQKFTRQKVHFSERDNQTYTAPHTCTLSGTDRYIGIKDDQGVVHRFLERPDAEKKTDHDESKLWEIFQKPDVPTVAEVYAGLIEKNILTLETCEMLADYTYYPGQKYYLARVATKDYGLIGAATGAGKSLMALSLIQIKAPLRALIIAPQGTMRGSDFGEEDEDGEEVTEHKASQWVEELRRFAPGQAVFELFSMDDYHRILKANNGQLPPGVYITYYQAFFINGARERSPDTWDDERLLKEMNHITERNGKLPPVPDEEAEEDMYWTRTIGFERHGIRCVMLPSMATLIGHNFDFVALDEAHVCKGLDSVSTQAIIRLQPRYRYAFTATPISNIITDLFPIMGWVCVPDWYKGQRCNAAWPFARHELGRFSAMFQSVERDITQEEDNRRANPDWRGKCEKKSPIISAPARLLKILKPSMAYISKKTCNPNLPDPVVTEVRVPMGEQQARLYGFFMNRGNIPAKHPLIRARKQIAYLRAVCADPAGFRHGGPRVNSNFNPKTAAILELTQSILAKGQPLVIVCARVGQTDTLSRLLIEAGVSIARVDSTIPAEQHSYQSNLFKRGKAQVQFMGIKCAVAYSFSECPNMIIGSLEYSPGSLDQAKGRIDRVNSKYQPHIWCILHKHSIEETQFDVVATKDDAAKICLHGQRVPRDYKPVDAGEVMALSFLNWENRSESLMNETQCAAQWPKLRDAIRKVV